MHGHNLQVALGRGGGAASAQGQGAVLGRLLRLSLHFLGEDISGIALNILTRSQRVTPRRGSGDRGTIDETGQSQRWPQMRIRNGVVMVISRSEIVLLPFPPAEREVRGEEEERKRWERKRGNVPIFFISGLEGLERARVDQQDSRIRPHIHFVRIGMRQIGVALDNIPIKDEIGKQRQRSVNSAGNEAVYSATSALVEGLPSSASAW